MPATEAYKKWVRAGRPYKLARWIVELEELAEDHGVRCLGDIGSDDEDHLQSSNPLDHCPFSTDAYPVPLPGYWVCAVDFSNGVHSIRILNAAREDKLPWLKYMIFGGLSYSRRRDNFATGKAHSDRHLHLSGMSNHLNTGLDGFNPFVVVLPPPPETDMGDDMYRMFIGPDKNIYMVALTTGKIWQLPTAKTLKVHLQDAHTVWGDKFLGLWHNDPVGNPHIFGDWDGRTMNRAGSV